MSRDEATVEKYRHLFPAKHNPKLPFVGFQQVILKDKLSTATEEELRTIQECIDKRFEQETVLRHHPWEARKIDDTQSDIDLERQYVRE